MTAADEIFHILLETLYGHTDIETGRACCSFHLLKLLIKRSWHSRWSSPESLSWTNLPDINHAVSLTAKIVTIICHLECLHSIW